MADTIKQPTPTPSVAPKSNDEAMLAKAKLHAESLEKECEALKGKAGFNPFIFRRSVLSPLTEALAKGDVEAAKKILELKVPVAQDIPVKEKV